MPRTPLQFQNMKDERKLSILKNALPLFALYQDKVSIDMICSKAKCSHGLIYHYYKNVDAVYDELINTEYYRHLLEELTKNDTHISAFDQFKEIIEILYNAKTIEDISYMNIIISNDGKNSFLNNMTSLLKRGQKEGDIINGNVNDISYCLILIFKGIYLSFLANKKAKIIKPNIENIFELFRKTYY